MRGVKRRRQGEERGEARRRRRTDERKRDNGQINRVGRKEVRERGIRGTKRRREQKLKHRSGAKDGERGSQQ